MNYACDHNQAPHLPLYFQMNELQSGPIIQMQMLYIFLMSFMHVHNYKFMICVAYVYVVRKSSN